LVPANLKLLETMPENEIAENPQPPPRVLVVDDEPEVCGLYQKALTRAGCVVQAANSGRAALEVLMQQSYDVLVIDLRMDEMSGLVFLEEALKIWPWMGVVIASAYVTEDVVARATALGVDKVLDKSPDLIGLCRNVIAEAGAKRRGQQSVHLDNALNLLRNHLRLLSRLAEETTGTESLVGALFDFGRALGDLLPSDMIGILVHQQDERVLLLTSRNAVHKDFADAVNEEMCARFETLSGARIDGEMLHVRHEGEPYDAGGPSEMASSLSVPIILEHEVCGLLTLASGDRSSHTPTDVSLLYHAANHISAAFMALRKMQHLAAQDPLTGVYNRIRLEDELERAWLFSRRYNFSMAVVIIDIDNFKMLNDSYDHSVGDQVLLEFVDLLRNVARASDVIARYGGDEFVAILPRAEEHDALAFTNRLLESARGRTFCEKSYRLKLTVSIGLATSLNPTSPSTAGELLSQADRALYKAKRAGRDQVCVWPGSDAAVQTQESCIAAPAAVADSTTRGRVLVVDDEALIRDVVERMLGDEGYTVTTLDSATKAIAELNSNPQSYDVVLTDLMMPEKSGIELLRELGDESLVKIVMTGYATVDNAISCLRENTYDFIQKPFGKKELLALVKRAVEYHELRSENSRYQKHLEQMVRERSAQVAASLEEVKQSYEFTLEALVAMLDARENYTGRHSCRVREMAVMLGRQMGVNKEYLQALASGALLHDIGKIGIPDAVLNKPGKLSDEEWEVMRRHPEIGYSIIRSSPYLRDAAEIVRAHHERYNGGGYPRHLKAEEICIGARIFAVIDAYDAMRSERVYRSAMPPDESCEEIRRNAGSQFDPEVVDAFFEHHAELERLWKASLA
jgi:diguanylate cyclase (GGDEF)-like protein/putative nucleotidyltransferase with HDIG domain